MAAQLFMMMAGVDMVHVAYRGSPPMLTDLLSGQIQAAFDGLSSPSNTSGPGKYERWPWAQRRPWRSYRHSDGRRFLPGYEASGWCDVVAPKNTPAEPSRSFTGRSMPL